MSRLFLCGLPFGDKVQPYHSPFALSVGPQGQSRRAVGFDFACYRKLRSARTESRQNRHGGSLRSALRCHDTRDCSPHPWGSPLRATRYGASLRLSRFAPGESVARGGRMPERTAAQLLALERAARKGKAQDAPSHPEVSSTPLSPPDTQNAPRGGVLRIWRERGIHIVFVRH